MLSDDIKNKILLFNFNFNNINYKNVKSLKYTKWQDNYQSLNNLIKICNNIIIDAKKINKKTNFIYLNKNLNNLQIKTSLIKRLIHQLSEYHYHLTQLETPYAKYDKDGYPLSVCGNKEASIKITKDFINTNSNSLWGLLKQIKQHISRIESIINKKFN